MRKLEVQLEDDLTGGPADETVLFAVDGRTYEIDLNARHAASFRHQLAAFVERAKLVPPRRSRTAVRTTASRERSRQIRAWAEQQGYPVSDHGRLPGDVVDQYISAHGGEQPAQRRPAARHEAVSERVSTKRPHRSAPSSRRRAGRKGN
jgi:hypothetical protein